MTIVRRFTTLGALLILLLSLAAVCSAFRASPISITRKTAFLAATPPPRQAPRRTSSSSTGLRMFMGSDGGLLGVGTPELFTVLLVGYFVLGPSDLYKLVKEIGKFIQNIRTLGTDLTTTLESNMESQLQLEELRKAQRELNDAFSFRRSINTDDTSEAFSTTATTPRPATVQDDIAASVASTASTSEDGSTLSKKKIRRRVRRKGVETQETANGSVPDLDMPAASAPEAAAAAASSTTKDAGQKAVDEKYANRPSDPFIEYSDKEKALIDEEFDKYVSLGSNDGDDNNNNKDDSKGSSSWYSEPDTAKSVPGSPSAASPVNSETKAADQSRFQQQMSGSWNEQIMANEEKLEPLAKVMQLLASLEEEKVASTKRLEEEYRKRAEMEEEYFQKQRKVLEEAAAQVQAAAAQQQSPKA